MPVTVGRFDTQNASKYLQQLCKHFGHRVSVEFTSEAGQADLPVGPAHMIAYADRLEISIELADLSLVTRAHYIIDSHLKTFAFREQFETMCWETT